MDNLSVTGLPKKLGDAVYIGTFESGSPEWHEQRAKGIGGSDVGILCGLSPWESSYTWTAKRLGLIETKPLESEAAEWGSLLEPVITEWFARKHPDLTVHTNVGTWHHVDRPWQQTNPDALYQTADGTWGVVEIKTAQYEDGWDEKSETIPPSYRAQVLWYLQTFGFSHAYVVVLFRGSKPRVFNVRTNQFEADTNLSIAADFWQMLQTKTMPPFTAPYNSTYETVRFIHPEIDDSEVELGTLGVTYFSALTQLEKAQEEVDLCKSHVAAAMGTAKRGTIEGVLAVTRQARGTGVPYLVTKKQK